MMQRQAVVEAPVGKLQFVKDNLDTITMISTRAMLYGAILYAAYSLKTAGQKAAANTISILTGVSGFLDGLVRHIQAYRDYNAFLDHFGNHKHSYRFWISFALVLGSFGSFAGAYRLGAYEDQPMTTAAFSAACGLFMTASGIMHQQEIAAAYAGKLKRTAKTALAGQAGEAGEPDELDARPIPQDPKDLRAPDRTIVCCGVAFTVLDVLRKLITASLYGAAIYAAYTLKNAEDTSASNTVAFWLASAGFVQGIALAIKGDMLMDRAIAAAGATIARTKNSAFALTCFVGSIGAAILAAYYHCEDSKILSTPVLAAASGLSAAAAGFFYNREANLAYQGARPEVRGAGYHAHRPELEGGEGRLAAVMA